MLNASASVARAASISAVDAATSVVRLMRKKSTRLRRIGADRRGHGTNMLGSRHATNQAWHQDGRFGEGDILSPK